MSYIPHNKVRWIRPRQMSPLGLTSLAVSIVVFFLIVFGVSHCVREEGTWRQQAVEQVTQNNKALVSNLPAGCKLDFLGEYDRYGKSKIPVVIVQCAASATTTTNTVNRPGKYDEPNTTVRIDGK